MSKHDVLSVQASAFTVWIVGGAITGLMAALELAALCRRLRLAVSIQLLEADAFGGGTADRTSSPRCQLWFHRHGTIYAVTQPAVRLGLQQSTRRLRRLAPDAFRWPLALAIDLPGLRRASRCTARSCTAFQ